MKEKGILQLIYGTDTRLDVDDIAYVMFDMLVDKLKNNKHTDDMWSDGDEILCKNEATAELLADIFEFMDDSCYARTGYYDPEKDKREGIVDDYTGYYYVSID